METSQPLPTRLDLASQVLNIKLYVPPVRSGHVLRPRLIERLDEGLQLKLTLLSALAGCARIPLISAWLFACERPAAWISFDAGDSASSQVHLGGPFSCPRSTANVSSDP